MSFRELFEQRPGEGEPEPKWYNEGAEFLLKTQTKERELDRSVHGGARHGFQHPIPHAGHEKDDRHHRTHPRGHDGGRARDSQGHQNVMRDANGQIVTRPLLGTGDKLIAALEKPDGRDFDKSIELLAALPGGEVESLAAKYGDKIRQLVGNKSPEARLAAVRA